MSNYQQDSGNFTTRTDNYGRREGFNDNQGGVESYGAGDGSGAYDPANTGLGGYGNRQGGFDGPDTATGLSGGFKNRPKWTTEVTAEGTGAERDEGFAVGSGGNETYGSGPGASATDPTNTGLGGYRGSQQAGGGGSRSGNDIDELGAQMESEHRRAQGERERQADKPTMVDRIRGTAEQWAGHISGDTDMQTHGERRASDDQY